MKNDDRHCTLSILDAWHSQSLMKRVEGVSKTHSLIFCGIFIIEKHPYWCVNKFFMCFFRMTFSTFTDCLKHGEERFMFNMLVN